MSYAFWRWAICDFKLSHRKKGECRCDITFTDFAIVIGIITSELFNRTHHQKLTLPICDCDRAFRIRVFQKRIQECDFPNLRLQLELSHRNFSKWKTWTYVWCDMRFCDYLIASGLNDNTFDSIIWKCEMR